MKKLCICLLATVVFSVLAWAEEEKVEPLKVLLVTGGSSHDYDNQKLILTEGVSARANVEWTIAHQGGKDRNQKIKLFQKSNWADGYDVVVHNQCFGGVVDVPFVEGIARVHAEGVPAVMIHCTAAQLPKRQDRCLAKGRRSKLVQPREAPSAEGNKPGGRSSGDAGFPQELEKHPTGNSTRSTNSGRA